MAGSDSQNNIVLRPIDINEIAEIIVEDMKAISLDSKYKVMACKARIKRIINFYKKDSKEGTVSTESNPNLISPCVSTSRDREDKLSRGILANATGLYEKLKMDTGVIGLMDQLETKNIKKLVVDDNITALRKKAEEDARKIHNCTRALEKAAKASIRGQLRDRQEESYDLARDDSPFVETLMLFEETNAKAKKVAETVNHNVRGSLSNLLTNPTGRKTGEEIESEKFLSEAMSQLTTKLKGDLENQKGVVDRNVDDIKSKVGHFLRLRDKDEKE